MTFDVESNSLFVLLVNTKQCGAECVHLSEITYMYLKPYSSQPFNFIQWSKKRRILLSKTLMVMLTSRVL